MMILFDLAAVMRRSNWTVWLETTVNQLINQSQTPAVHFAQITTYHNMKTKLLPESETCSGRSLHDVQDDSARLDVKTLPQ